jgi:hypothetical protein
MAVLGGKAMRNAISKKMLVPATALAAGLLLWSLVPGPAGGHTSGRLRLAHRADPELTALAHLTEIFLEETSAYQVDLKEFPDPDSLREAIRQGAVDLAVEFPAEAWARACPTRGALMQNIFHLMKDYYEEEFGAIWIGMFNLRKDGLLCFAPSYVLSHTIVDSLTYYTLPDYLKKLLKAVSQEDMDELLRKDPTGSRRRILESYLAEKGLI